MKVTFGKGSFEKSKNITLYLEHNKTFKYLEITELYYKLKNNFKKTSVGD